MTLPDFIIVGAMKAGTSSLVYHMKNHKDISMPDREVHFFDVDKNYLKGPEYYSEVLQRNVRNEKQMVGEKSPPYCYLPIVPERIFKLTPKAKLIWMLRNPVDRSYSNFLHARKVGFEYLSSFEKAFKKEHKRLKKSVWYGYFERSRYHKQIQRYLKYFNSDKMHFIIFENFINNPKYELKILFDFLNLEYSSYKYSEAHINKTVLPRFQKLMYFNDKLFRRGTLPYLLFKNLSYLGTAPGYEKLSDNMRERLSSYFYEDNQKLQNMINKDLSFWNC